MLAMEERMRRWREGAGRLRSETINAVVAAYFEALGKPEHLDVEAAKLAAENALKKQIPSQKWVDAISESPIPDSDNAALKLSFIAVRPALRLPEPQIISELSPVRIGLAALVGAIGGMMILTPLARLLLDMRDTGLFVGAPVGAFVMVIAVWHSARSERLKRFLIWALGVAIIAEVWVFLTGGGVFGRVWSKLRQRGSVPKRILLYVAVIIVLMMARRRTAIDRKGHEQAIRSAIDQWLDSAILTMGLLLYAREQKAAVEMNAEANLSELVQKVMDLRRIPPSNLSIAAEELIQVLKNMGFQVEPLSQSILWQPEMRDQYEVFGIVEPGDQVVIEREPVVFQDSVKQKGLVRKVRDRS
jgi:hypothetical protein